MNFIDKNLYPSMSKNPKKRKATSQLTPHNEEEISDEKEIINEPICDRKRASIKKQIETVDTEALKGVFATNKTVKPADLFKPENKKESAPNQIKTGNDKVSGLNLSFYKSIAKVLEKQSNKDLRFLFKQYTKFLEDILEEKVQEITNQTE